MAEQPGDGGRGHSWFAIEVTSDYVDPALPPPPTEDGAGGLEGGFTGPVVPRPVAFRFPARVRGRTIEPFEARVAASARVVRTVEWVVPGETHAVREVVFTVSGFRDPAYHWSEVLRDDDEVLAILYAR